MLITCSLQCPIVSPGEVLDQLTQSMSDYYNFNDQSTSISMSSLEKAGSQSYAAAKLNDKEWHRYTFVEFNDVVTH